MAKRSPHRTLASHRGKQVLNDYNPSIIESKWQRKWEESKIFSPDMDKAKKPFYNLMMFPYPSAEGLHVGNMYAFTGSDIYGRYTRMRGFDVFEPIGLDGFGIHSENYALKIGRHPAAQAKVSERNFYRQLHATGNAYDWTRNLETYDPDYYRWTQWIFVQMFRKGLAYKSKAPVNWCPSCKTVLADEQIITGRCERCNSIVEKRNLEQWFFKITDYADRLLDGLTRIDWSEKVKIAQRNWIGRSGGTEIQFTVYNLQFTIPVFTTRPDTLFGATFMVLAPEHPLLTKINTSEYKQRVSDYVKKAAGRADNEHDRSKTGVFTGAYCINPVTNEKIPIWVADYVSMEYGTGAIMAVPAHDQRDFEFAKKYKLPIKQVIKPRSGEWNINKNAYVGEGIIVNSNEWNGWDVLQDIPKVTTWLEKHGLGKKEIHYHLRDWLISRQRYWGPPIPMIYCEECAKAKRGEREDIPGWYAVPEEDLPVELPYIKDYRPTGTGVSPLAAHEEFYRVACPECGSTARRETDVSDTFLDSAWYFFRYTSIEDKTCPWKPERGRKWLPVDMYIGGAEHSVLHLLYARFITMVFADWGLINFAEPFKKFYAHGLLISGGAKMSKSRGNVVNPDDYVRKYGVDTLRTYLMFLGPFDQGGDFRDTGIEGMHRFMKRVWRLVSEHSENSESQKVRKSDKSDSLKLRNTESSEFSERMMHKTIKKVTEDLENLRYNTAIAALMEYVNFLREKTTAVDGSQSTVNRYWDETIRTLLLLLAPFAPHMTEELWQVINEKTKKQKNQKIVFQSIHLQSWPNYDPELIQEEEVTIPVQVNGRLRATLRLRSGQAIQKEVVEKEARKNDRIAQWLHGQMVKNVIFVPGKLINFVTE